MDGFWPHLWKRRFKLAGIWLVIMILVLIRLFTMREVYTSSCLMMPLPLEQVEQGSDGGFGGSSVRSLLAGGGSSDAYAVAAFLQSGQLMNAVIKDLDLSKELFPRSWNSKTKKWDGDPPHEGKSRRAFNHRLDVTYDGFTGLLEMEIHWWSAERAQQIATAVVATADQMLRDTAIADGERRVKELRREMQSATVSEIGGFLAEEVTRAISSLASMRARTGYAFRIIDPPLVPDKKSWPPRLVLLVLIGMIAAAVELGVVAGMLLRGSTSGRHSTH